MSTKNTIYFDRFLENYLKNNFNITLHPAQLDVFKQMFLYDYVMFQHGRATGATFLLTVLSAMLKSIDKEVKIGITAPIIRQSKIMKNAYRQSFEKFNLKEPELIEINKINLINNNRYNSIDIDVLLVDEATSLTEVSIDILINHIKNKNISKIAMICGGHRKYFKIVKLIRYLHSSEEQCVDSIGKVIIKSHEDMPEFFDEHNLKQARKIYKQEEFDLEYNARVI